MTFTRLLSALAASASFWLAPALHADAAGPTEVTCGSTITTDTTLTHDLLNCSGIGLIIGADDLTLDLNGHLVDGDGVGDAEGIQIDGHDHVVVKNGAIRDFVEGVAALAVVDVRIWDVRVANSRHVGIFVVESERVRVRDSSVLHTTFAGVYVARSSDVLLAENYWAHNAAGLFVSDSPGTRVRANLVGRNGFAGLLIETDGAVVRDNTVRRNGNSVIVFANRVQLRRNQIIGAVGCHQAPPDACILAPPGFCATCQEGFGISVEGGRGNRVVENRVLRTRRDGIRVGSFDPGLPTRDTVVRANRVRRATHDGIIVSTEGEGPLGAVLLARNRALGAGGDGIDVRSRDTTVTANVANRNDHYGITAVRGTTDGGGNRARDNGRRAQCRNISCTP